MASVIDAYWDRTQSVLAGASYRFCRWIIHRSISFAIETPVLAYPERGALVELAIVEPAWGKVRMANISLILTQRCHLIAQERTGPP